MEPHQANTQRIEAWWFILYQKQPGRQLKKISRIYFFTKKRPVRNSKCIRIRSFFLVYFHFGIEKVQNLLDQSANKAHIHRLLRKCLANTEWTQMTVWVFSNQQQCLNYYKLKFITHKLTLLTFWKGHPNSHINHIT